MKTRTIETQGKIQIISNPTSQVDVQYYNKEAGLIAEIIEGSHGYIVEYFREIRGTYFKAMQDRRDNLGSACVIARRFVETGNY